MLFPTGPGSSDYHYNSAPSFQENIDSLTSMLTGSPLSYEKESCERLFASITSNLPDKHREMLSKIIDNPLDFEPVYVEETLEKLRSLEN